MKLSRVASACLLAGGALLGGCEFAHLFGGMAQNYEYSMLKEVHATYEGLENHSVAVIVNADLATLYEHPDVAMIISANVAHRIQSNVEGSRVLSPRIVSDWQFRTPQWSALPYSDVTSDLDVDRLVIIDLHEFRLHPRGNRWLWEGVCTANVGVVERDGFDPDTFTDMFEILSEFPKEKGVGRESADATRIQAGLLHQFVEATGWLFYKHLEAKHPDQYRGESPEAVFKREREKERAKQAKQAKQGQ